MRIPYFQVNAFTADPFGGNPAGVCLLDSWLADELLQQVAAENDLSETAFLVAEQGGFRLRWMTPTTEVDLCGHATLASAHVLLFERAWPKEIIIFETVSGRLTATRKQDMIELDFPARPPQSCAAPATLIQALGSKPREILKSRDYLVVFDSLEEVAALKPDMARLATLDLLGVIATAPGRDADFVSRFFAPKVGVPEDPVTGSAHCTLVPFWAERLEKTQLLARQISRRGGELHCRVLDDRVGIAGRSVVYLRGELEIL